MDGGVWHGPTKKLNHAGNSMPLSMHFAGLCSTPRCMAELAWLRRHAGMGAHAQQHATEGHDAPTAAFTPSDLLLGLPDLACQALIQRLVASGSRKLTELMTLCRSARQLVMLHAPRIKYTPAGAPVSVGATHADLHAAATRSAGSLELVLDFYGAPEGAAVGFLQQAAQLGNTGGKQGWSAVTKLTMSISLSVSELDQIVVLCGVGLTIRMLKP